MPLHDRLVERATNLPYYVAMIEAVPASLIDGPGKAVGVAFSTSVGQALMKQRADGRFGAPNTYRAPTPPGVYVPPALPVSGDLPAAARLCLIAPTSSAPARHPI